MRFVLDCSNYWLKFSLKFKVLLKYYKNNKFKLALPQFLQMTLHEVVTNNEHFGVGDFFQLGHHTDDLAGRHVRQQFADLRRPAVSCCGRCAHEQRPIVFVEIGQRQCLVRLAQTHFVGDHTTALLLDAKQNAGTLKRQQGVKQFWFQRSQARGISGYERFVFFGVQQVEQKTRQWAYWDIRHQRLNAFLHESVIVHVECPLLGFDV